MTMRTFVFCDGCNPQGIRNINSDEPHLRRNSDGRAWYEGIIEDGVTLGWGVTEIGDNFCPSCVERGIAK